MLTGRDLVRARPRQDDEIKMPLKFIYNFYLVIEVPDHVYVLGISSSISDCCISIFRFSWCCLSYSVFLPPSAFRAYTCVYVARVKVIASRRFLTVSVTWFTIHVSSSAEVTSRFLTKLSSEHTPPKTYTCQEVGQVAVKWTNLADNRTNERLLWRR